MDAKDLRRELFRFFALYTIVTTFVVMLLSAGWSLAAPVVMSSQEAMNRSRAIKPATGAATSITATAAASAVSAQLSANSLYIMKCDNEVYVRWCTSTSCTAASGDFKLPADTLFPFLTDDTLRYVAARNTTTDGSCWVVEGR